MGPVSCYIKMMRVYGYGCFLDALNTAAGFAASVTLAKISGYVTRFTA